MGLAIFAYQNIKKVEFSEDEMFEDETLLKVPVWVNIRLTHAWTYGYLSVIKLSHYSL
jgi:hypothetical protein